MNETVMSTAEALDVARERAGQHHEELTEGERAAAVLVARLEAISTRLKPCSPPDVFNGFDLCLCGHGGSFPCPTTEAAWLARGLDPAAESRKAIATMRPDDVEA